MQKIFVFLLVIISVVSVLGISSCGTSESRADSQETALSSSNQGSSQPTDQSQDLSNGEAAASAPEPTPEPAPAATPASTNPDDYWVSDSEYDLIGFMAACGYHQEDTKQPDDHTRIKFVNNHHGYDRIIIFAYHFKAAPSRTDLIILHKEIKYTITDADSTPIEIKNPAGFAGDLAGYETINKDTLVEYLPIITQIDQKLDEGHCPFNDTIGSRFTHNEENRNTGEHSTHYYGNIKIERQIDYGTCY